MRIEQLPANIQEQVRAKLAAEEAARRPAVPTASGPAEPEAKLQAAAERYLQARGYARRAPKAIQRHARGRWFIHLTDTERNPILLDLLILDSRRGAYLELELKTATGELTPDQCALVLRGEGKLCRSIDDVRRAVETWEEGEGHEMSQMSAR
ncbi:MAG: hypothetical protein K8T26_19460 [Lentisphaerae bacterium]|nr:hypothetical protein [Lentisphaerota bacterium]